jgi:hypothetical protein
MIHGSTDRINPLASLTREGRHELAKQKKELVVEDQNKVKENNRHLNECCLLLFPKIAFGFSFEIEIFKRSNLI